MPLAYLQLFVFPINFVQAKVITYIEVIKDLFADD